jgi:hypothetical protein
MTSLSVQLAVLAMFMPAALVGAEDADHAAARRAANKRQVAAWHAERVAALQGRPDIMQAPGLIADRTAKRIEFRAEATGLGPRDTVEFFLIGENSGHAYEAIAVALTRPQAIYDALMFLGLSPGRGTDPSKLRFWPKGERVVMAFDGIRVETLIFDTREEQPLRPAGLVFTGSTQVPQTNGAPPRLAADTREPFSIAANYNEADSLLDVPWQAPQDTVYDRQVLNPHQPFPKGKLLTVILRPEFTNGTTRVRDLEVAIAAPPPTAVGLEAVRCTVRCAQQPELNASYAIDRALGLFSKLNADGHDPFVVLSFDDAMPLGLVRKTCELLGAIDNEKGIRVDAPPAQQLYYKAFMPPAGFRDRAQRTAQPWELHLSLAKGAVAASLTRITEHWEEQALKPRLEVRDYPLAAPADLPVALEKLGPGLPVIIAYAPGDVTLGQVMAYLRPVMATHPIIHVFVD